jgi:excisionase family DNA binding protein
MSSAIEKYYTIKEAAALLGLKYWQLQRAVRAQTVPSYRLGSSRRARVLLSEIIASIETTRVGGAR